jgi:hypothetical protein
LNKDLAQLASDFNSLEIRVRQENRDAVQKRVYTVTGQELPEEDIDQLIETGGRGVYRGGAGKEVLIREKSRCKTPKCTAP